MSDDSPVKEICIVFGILLATALSVMVMYAFREIGHSDGGNEVRAEAVEKGHAEWVIVDTTGKTEFRWKEAQPEVK